MLYDWQCECGYRESTWASIANRDAIRPVHVCGMSMHRLPGGRGMLYFEEGRARSIESLTDKPITSLKQHKKLMRDLGVSDSGEYLPKQVRDNPKSMGMQRYLEKDKKGRWI